LTAGLALAGCTPQAAAPTAWQGVVQTLASQASDGDYASATATLLRARAIGMAATGERELLSRALDDLRAFAPNDALGATLVRRMVTTKGGPIDVRDLTL